ncbi:hypothetical protein BCR32DRAFT_286595 [Anaeromyces robustus]|uniref:Uncharacterized protein n=1 Tax=Anaeromyces robustus TaxID=1754192 RepID=A0A1Y1VVG5_9FUNG|nr:hypothetical protein BCR32DRAFT_286595 [Anaeromyces robustus]|eukprot:ORX65282.1 hypothetical protein BCR32DRAFT_286595 [Anaeromyces robustus]
MYKYFTRFQKYLPSQRKKKINISISTQLTIFFEDYFIIHWSNNKNYTKKNHNKNEENFTKETQSKKNEKGYKAYKRDNDLCILEISISRLKFLSSDFNFDKFKINSKRNLNRMSQMSQINQSTYSISFTTTSSSSNSSDFLHSTPFIS